MVYSHYENRPMSIEFDNPPVTENPENGEVQPTTTTEATESTENGQANPVVSADAVTPSADPVQKTEDRITAVVERKPESKKRLSITVNFPGEEAEYLEQIIEARIKSGLTADKGHFLRQCVDFAIHMEKLYGRHQAGFSFATPKDLPVIYMKGGFFKKQ